MRFNDSNKYKLSIEVETLLLPVYCNFYTITRFGATFYTGCCPNFGIEAVIGVTAYVYCHLLITGGKKKSGPMFATWSKQRMVSVVFSLVAGCSWRDLKSILTNECVRACVCVCMCVCVCVFVWTNEPIHTWRCHRRCSFLDVWLCVKTSWLKSDRSSACTVSLYRGVAWQMKRLWWSLFATSCVDVVERSHRDSCMVCGGRMDSARGGRPNCFQLLTTHDASVNNLSLRWKPHSSAVRTYRVAPEKHRIITKSHKTSSIFPFKFECK